TGLTPDAHGNLVGSAASPLDPRLGPLQDNGGPTLTLAPPPGSPALDPRRNPPPLPAHPRGLPPPARAAPGTGAPHVPGPPPPPPPSPPPGQSPPRPVSVVLAPGKQGKTVRLVAQVTYTNGLPPRVLVAPFQKPRYRSIAAVLRDLNGDGVFDAVVFTARLG